MDYPLYYDKHYLYSTIINIYQYYEVFLYFIKIFNILY